MPRVTKNQLIKACEGKSARSGGLNKEDLVKAIVRRVPRERRPHIDEDGDIVDASQGRPLTAAEFTKELMAYNRHELSEMCLIYGYIPGTWPPEGPQGEAAEKYYGQTSTTVRQRKKSVPSDISDISDISDGDDDDLFTLGPKAKVSNETRTQRACLGFSESQGGMNKQDLIDALITKIPNSKRPEIWQDDNKMRNKLNSLPRESFDLVCEIMGIDMEPWTPKAQTPKAQTPKAQTLKAQTLKAQTPNTKKGEQRKSVTLSAEEQKQFRYFYSPAKVPTGIDPEHAVQGYHYQDIRKGKEKDMWTLGRDATGQPIFVKVGDPKTTTGTTRQVFQRIGNWKKVFNEGLTFPSKDEPYRWITSPVTSMNQNVQQEFIQDTKLPTSDQADASAYLDKFNNPSNLYNYRNVSMFYNPTKDAILVVPDPKPQQTPTYATLRDFVEMAPEDEQKNFWKVVVKAIQKGLKKWGKVWVNTHGHGVPYLHVRIDSTPKYYPVGHKFRE
jgi:hypothetical protein